MSSYILNRLQERSTWLGIIALATACGATIGADAAEYVISAGMALAGLIAVFTSDSASTTTSASSETSAASGKEEIDG